MRIKDGAKCKISGNEVHGGDEVGSSQKSKNIYVYISYICVCVCVSMCLVQYSGFIRITRQESLGLGWLFSDMCIRVSLLGLVSLYGGVSRIVIK